MVSACSMAVDFGGIKMRNPVGVASGTFGFGEQFEPFFDVGETLGSVTCKGCSAVPWQGNPAPRLAELPSGLMNAVGLQNPGIRALVSEHGEYLRGLEERGCRVIVQAAGHSVSEYVEAVELYEELMPYASGIELNVSCPNVDAGGAAMGSTPEGAAGVVRAVRDRTSRPLIVKMAPVSPAEVARACEAAGADALSLINTIPGMAIDVRTRRSRVSRPTAGVSGPAIHAIAVRMVWEAAQACALPICGIGGIECADDAAEMVLAGASCVAVGTANLSNPMAAAEVAAGLAEWAASQGAASIDELRGGFIW